MKKIDKDEKRFFNAPIQLLSGFMEDSKACLVNIFDYAICYHAENSLIIGDLSDKIKSSCKYFGVKTGSIQRTASNGKALINSIPANSPKFGISVEIYFEFYKNDKPPLEKACLLAFLAIKSINNTKPYSKITNLFLWARMDGKTHSITSTSELSPGLQFYANDYQTGKIKKQLRDSWRLVYYGRYTRGCYYSFTLKLEDLVFHAEKRRKSNKDKIYKLKELEAVQQALIKLNNSIR